VATDLEDDGAPGVAAGRNTLRFYNEQGWCPDLDRIVVRD
jgi:hypothetical protein